MLPSLGPMLLWTAVLLFVPCVGKTAWLNLQAWPNPVFEGDALTLRCQGRKNTSLSQVRFYRDGKFLHLSKENQTLSMGAATVQSRGQYSCSGQVMYIPQTPTQTSETVMVQVQELFPSPVLSAIPSPEPRVGSLVILRCQTKLHPLRSASRLLFSFHKDGHTLQDRGPHSELCIPGVKEGDSGLYWCEAAPEGGQVRKQSPQLEVRVQAPVSPPVLTLHHGPADPAVGDMVQLLCETQRGSPPILYSFYLDEKIVGNHSAPYGGTASLLFPVKSEQDAGNYSCEAENSVSRERSEPKKLSLNGSQVLSTPTSSNWLVPWLPASLLGLMVIAATLLVYLRPWRKAGPLPSQIPPTSPGGEQCPLYANARPAEFTAGRKDSSIIYAEVRCLQPSEVSSEEVNIRSRTPQEPLGDCEEVLC
ncbi:Fc receptor-like protein 6 [Nomascus leucogenys]|uniref:Fc receptor-like protein 6 n=1 Tax=Nomascus leucogenys TaxID=61853 RepID=UPI00122D5C97|nr:Fc receptor-like protein 6 [Nomascus leucogenys]